VGEMTREQMTRGQGVCRTPTTIKPGGGQGRGTGGGSSAETLKVRGNEVRMREGWSMRGEGG